MVYLEKIVCSSPAHVEISISKLIYKCIGINCIFIKHALMDSYVLQWMRIRRYDDDDD